MAKVVYFDCPTGIAGNMCLGALVHLGVPIPYLQEHLDRLKLGHEYEITQQRVQRLGQDATLVEVTVHHPHPEQHHPHGHPAQRHLPEITTLIQQARLPAQVEQWSLQIFETLAIAEGQVHGIPPEAVHFHEVGAVDAIVDIVGTCLGLDWLGIKQVYCSALPTGGGTVKAAHGLLPVPAPAVLNLWASRQVPLYHNGIDRELVTPTGAAIVTTLADQFGSPPRMRLQNIGLGAGTLSLPQANILRLWLGEMMFADEDSPAADAALEMIMILETQLDDLSPQIVGYLYDLLFEVGAVDVFTQAVGMKKSRPGVLLTVLCPPTAVTACETLLFRETSTLGIRRSLQQRSVLSRRIEQVATPLGEVGVKVATHRDRVVNLQPEYEDCVRLARTSGRSLQDIQRLALSTWETLRNTNES
jgi:pyridinium-3,5-bisthiocarboxylic acid mononucleotide nickel chelatase